MSASADFFDGLSDVLQAGADKCRSWPMNVAMSQQAEVYQEMANEAKRQAIYREP